MSRLLDLALVIFLMFKIFGVIEISKIEFYNFSGTVRVNKIQKR